MERTVLFVGTYHNKTYTEHDDKTATYNMSLAYLLATGACFVISFILIIGKLVNLQFSKQRRMVLLVNFFEI